MKITKKLIKWGDSLGITIPVDIVEALSLKEGNVIELDIAKLNIAQETKTYHCLACDLEFDTDDEFPYCPACQDAESKVEEVKQ